MGGNAARLLGLDSERWWEGRWGARGEVVPARE